MNKIENYVYHKIKNNVKLKNTIRDCYQLISVALSKNESSSNHEITTREGYFFGFHDKTPWSGTNDKLLAHKYPNIKSLPQIGDKAEVGYFYGKNLSKFKKVAETNAWNWQQGSMLQWVGEGEVIIFNDWNKSFISRIVALNGDVNEEIPAAIGSISPNGTLGLSYSFDRLNVGMPGYGYPHSINDKEICEKDATDTFLSIVDLKSFQTKKLFSLEEIAGIERISSMDQAFHFFSHCIFSPSGDRFLFLHRWVKEGRRLQSRIITCNVDGSELFVLPTDNMASHLTWLDEKHIFAYCNTIVQGDGYYIMEDKSPDNIRLIDRELFPVDGHPQYCERIGRIVTDTYPDRIRMQELSIYDPVSNTKEIEATLFSPFRYRNTFRCDLHPRWDRYGKQICFDSVHTGERSLCTIML